MPLVTSTEMFKKAYDGGYAIGAFNVNNMEIVQGITEACQEEHAPVILQVSKGARAYANHNYLVKLVEAAVICCPDIPIPVPRVTAPPSSDTAGQNHSSTVRNTGFLFFFVSRLSA